MNYGNSIFKYIPPSLILGGICLFNQKIVFGTTHDYYNHQDSASFKFSKNSLKNRNYINNYVLWLEEDINISEYELSNNLTFIDLTLSEETIIRESDNQINDIEITQEYSEEIDNFQWFDLEENYNLNSENVGENQLRINSTFIDLTLQEETIIRESDNNINDIEITQEYSEEIDNFQWFDLEENYNLNSENVGENQLRINSTFIDLTLQEETIIRESDNNINDIEITQEYSEEIDNFQWFDLEENYNLNSENVGENQLRINSTFIDLTLQEETIIRESDNNINDIEITQEYSEEIDNFQWFDLEENYNLNSENVGENQLRINSTFIDLTLPEETIVRESDNQINNIEITQEYSQEIDNFQWFDLRENYNLNSENIGENQLRINSTFIDLTLPEETIVRESDNQINDIEITQEYSQEIDNFQWFNLEENYNLNSENVGENQLRINSTFIDLTLPEETIVRESDNQINNIEITQEYSQEIDNFQWFDLRENYNLNSENIGENQLRINSTFIDLTLPEETIVRESDNQINDIEITQEYSQEIDNFQWFDLEVTQISETELNTFPIGLNLRKRNAVASVIIRGYEDGYQAIDFENWLIPFNDFVQALQFQITYLEDNQIEMRSSGLITRINTEELTIDSELGEVISIAQIKTLFNIDSEFDLIEYAIIFNPPWLDFQGNPRKNNTEIPVILDGLPEISASNFAFTNFAQEININGRENNEDNNYNGNLTALGTILNSSWYIRINQSDVTDTATWRLQELQVLKQRPTQDYIFGSHPRFWLNDSNGQFWGMTTLQRWGFEPPTTSFSYNGGGFNPRQRLQANEIRRTIVGETEPGTLVQLTQGYQDEIIAETLVDSTGIYRFENVLTGRNSRGNNYRVLLYRDGQLTNLPEIRTATFQTLLGQLPHHSSALAVSVGTNREFSNNNFWGNFNDLVGGISFRHGISEDLTLGIGAVYDKSPRVLGELFYQPSNMPLQVEVSAITNQDNSPEITSNINFRLFDNLNFRFSSDRFSEKFNLNWHLFPNMSFFLDGNSRDDFISGSLQFSTAGRGYNFFSRITGNTQNKWRWSINSRLNRLKFSSLGNEISTTSNLEYNLTGRNASEINLNVGHSFFLKYNTNQNNRNLNNLTTLGWRYRSPTRLQDSRYLWDLELGYGLGNQGNGIVLSASTGLIPGLILQGTYQDISASTNESAFSIEIASILNFQRGISPDTNYYDRLRRQGGLLIQPFYDSNNNAKKDSNEELYLENPELMIIINNQPIKSLLPDIRNNGFYISLAPDTYRIDLDPVGFPIDWNVKQTAYAVEVVEGNYTNVLIPLTPSYSFIGVAKDSENKVIAGHRIEAILENQEQTFTSITNSAGVFYLEGLTQGTYHLLINGEPAIPSKITIDQNSEPYQELNLTTQ